MAENSKIEWTDHTFNPWIGCTKVSDGCKYCYAENLMDKRYKRVEWGPQGTRKRTSAANWRKPLAWNKQAEKEGRRYRVFCASLADVFEDKPDQPEMTEWRFDLLCLIKKTPHLDWLLLTKRPENVIDMIEYHLAFANGAGDIYEIFDWLLPNVWIGTSVENQEQADKRIPELAQIPARARFLSCEPLLGPIDLSAFYGSVSGTQYVRGYPEDVDADWSMIDWVIAGGESGPNARPMHPDWARSLRAQCQAAGVPFLFKQWGEWLPNNQIFRPETISSLSGYDMHFWEHGITKAHSLKVGKKKAGRLLDGREWNEFPVVEN